MTAIDSGRALSVEDRLVRLEDVHAHRGQGPRGDRAEVRPGADELAPDEHPGQARAMAREVDRDDPVAVTGEGGETSTVSPTCGSGADALFHVGSS